MPQSNEFNSVALSTTPERNRYADDNGENESSIQEEGQSNSRVASETDKEEDMQLITE